MEKYLKIYVGRLRRKLEPSAESTRYIVSVHGVGYRLDPNPSGSN
jgi:DNA-binding response OmpR family regulator